MVLFSHVSCFLLDCKNVKDKCTDNLGSVEEGRLFYEDSSPIPARRKVLVHYPAKDQLCVLGQLNSPMF